jgi:hypothetical protein
MFTVARQCCTCKLPVDASEVASIPLLFVLVGNAVFGDYPTF